MIKFSLLGETILEWNDKDIEQGLRDRYIGSLFRVDEPVPDDQPLQFLTIGVIQPSCCDIS